VVPAYAAGDVRWGLPALVHAVDRAAKAVNKKYPGAVLGVGDISRRGGGDVIRHHSHESGRDADLAFYMLDEQKKQVERQGFIKVNDKLEATEVSGAHFDVSRNWLLVQSLLLDREARVSHIFVTEPVKQALLAHARKRGVSKLVLTRAAQVLMEPTGAPTHDDHFHVRISCPKSAKKHCVEIAKNAPSKAKKVKLAKKKGQPVVKTPAPKQAAAARTKKTKPAEPQKAATDTQATNSRPKGIYLSRAVKATEQDNGVPVTLWALMGSGEHGNEGGVSHQGREEAEADAAEVKDAIDESGAPKITQ
jgi:penicillin-insensitive murein endopeptidase